MANLNTPSLQELIALYKNQGANVDVPAIGDRAAQGLQLQDTILKNKQAHEDRTARLQQEIEAAKAARALAMKKAEPKAPAFSKIGETDNEIILADLSNPTNQVRVKTPGKTIQPAAPKLSVGQESADRAFGKDYNDYVAQGGTAGFSSNLSKLDKSINTLEQLGQKSGTSQTLLRASGILPDRVRGFIAPEYKRAEQDARSNVLGILRQTLGAQFTEKEGERIFSQTFDPTLPIGENVARLKALRDSLAATAGDKEAAIRHFEQNQGSLSGFKGRLPDIAPGTAPKTGIPGTSGLTPEQRRARIAQLKAKIAGGQ